MTDKNAYSTSANAVRSNNSYALGYIGLTATNNTTVTITTCIADACSSNDNRLTATISTE